MQPYQHQISYSLHSGLDIVLRTVLSEDKSKFKEGFKLLSPESRHSRFFSYLNTISENQLEYLTNVDQLNHVAWGALDPEKDPDSGIGVGRFIRTEACPNCAEIALTILDEYQSKGIGTALLGLMYLLAQTHGIEFFTGSMLVENYRFMNRLKRLGAETTSSEGIFEFKLPIYQDLNDLPENEFTPRWKKMLAEMGTSLFDIDKPDDDSKIFKF
jgi:GNAT superfamily N-acetyltransferase